MKKIFTVLLTSLFLVFTAAFTYSIGNADNVNRDRNRPQTENIARTEPRIVESGELNIHFLELGNKYTGDCVYINYGEIDIIIDAGSRQSSAAVIKNYIDGYTLDGKLEFVIVTHAHQDHIAGFNSSRNIAGILDSYETGIIIDFPRTNSTTVVYNTYRETRQRAIKNGAIHYNALQCYNNEDGAQRVYDLGGNVQLEILYNYYYENYSGNENNYSVVLRIIQDTKQFLFTGDLEKDGEDRLVDYYEANFGGLGVCELFKGGHHGSRTSGNEKLMAAITPEYIIVCSCAGSSEYRASPQNVFPAQAFIDRAAPYTDKIYITTFVPDYANNTIMSFNGNIIFSVTWVNSQRSVRIICSSNDLKLKDTEWFLANRQMPEAWKKQ